MTLQHPFSPAPEWLETDGLGGFSMGSADLLPFRRYHALLTVALTPPTRRMAMLNLLDMCIVQGGNRFPLHRFRFHPGVTLPDAAAPIRSFTELPFPTWTFTLPDEQVLTFELLRIRDEPIVLCSWRWEGKVNEETILEVRPLISGRSIHSLHAENSSFDFTPRLIAHGVVWQPYQNLPALAVCANGEYHHAPEWYRNFRYEEDEQRGYPGAEDLAAPGVFRFKLSEQPAVMIAAATASGSGVVPSPESFYHLRSKELDRRTALGVHPEHLHHSAQQYIVRRGKGSSIIAGYPWFSDWGRDTLIALRGLTITLKRFDEAAAILRAWAHEVSQGMLPNVFSDEETPPLFNSVDAALWFVVACYSLWTASPEQGENKDPRLVGAIEEILTNYRSGTRFNIRADSDGLLACGTPGVQLTWMDAKVGEVVFTPRIGKPVEIQALWINALKIGSELNPSWQPLAEQAANSFSAKFWNSDQGMLFDVVDLDHRRGQHDPAIRPNQIFAVGGLPFMTIEGERARAVVDAVESHLFTPGGLRSLAPSDPAYRGRYRGAQWDRDAAYHQGTAWAWLVGPFVEGWLRVRKQSKEAKREAMERFVRPSKRGFNAQGSLLTPRSPMAMLLTSHGAHRFRRGPLANIFVSSRRFSLNRRTDRPKRDCSIGYVTSPCYCFDSSSGNHDLENFPYDDRSRIPAAQRR